MENKKRCISCGTCNKKYCFLILGAFIIYMALGIFNFVFLYFFYENNEENEFNIINIMSYTFFSSLCESLMIIPDLILKRKIKSEKDDSSNKEQNRNITIKYIFNPNTVIFSLKEKIYFFSAALLKLILDIIFILYQYYFSKYYYMLSFVLIYYFHFELICLFLLSKLMFNTKYYRHQYFSIIVLAIAGFAKFIIYFYDVGLGYFFLHLLIHLAYSTCKSLLTVYMKGLMEYKYVTPYKACYLMGIFNFFITTIIYIIVSFYPCDNSLCRVEYNNKKYFGNILTIFNYSSLFTLGCVLIKTILLILTYKVINDFSVCHSFLIGQILSVLEYSSNYIYNNFFILTIVLILFVINIFFILVFLEIIQINICKLNYDLKKYIERRATQDLLIIESDENSLDEEDM